METSEIIYNVIVDEPGIHFRAIMQRLEKQTGVISYHLNRLEKDDQIISIRHRKEKLFFEKSWDGKIEEIKALISNLRKKIPRIIIISLNNYPETSTLTLNEFSELLAIPRSSFYWYVKNLIEDGVLEPERKGRTVSISLKVNKIVVDQLGRIIIPNRWDKLLDDVDSIFHFLAV
ncbi:MAG: winged helix-turn-helix transcriptional regulator [Candidatus Heimdallarchaeota archaeon]|nr:winged helix-turn-helix transcriptional regulator [Candidatus Heimdallarchaeota archaeon]